MYHPKKQKHLGIFNIIDNKCRLVSFCLILFGVFVLVFGVEGTGWCLGWPDIKVRLLSDECFAVVEYDGGTPVRHCPYLDINGKLDEEQLIYVLGSLDREKWVNPKNKEKAKKHLEKHYDRFKTKAMKKELIGPLNINDASLTELVMLPQIGPVLAVKIVEYRNTHNMYITIEEMKKVDGIGQGIFNAIRHYISTD